MSQVNLPEGRTAGKTATDAGTRAGPLRFSPAIPDRSFAAQVWKPDGTSLAVLDDVNDEGTAYARLFAAAPDLLDAATGGLLFIRMLLNDCVLDPDLQRNAEVTRDIIAAAVAKAKVTPLDSLTAGDLDIPTPDEMFPRAESGVVRG